MNENHPWLYPPDATRIILKTLESGLPQRVRWESVAHPPVLCLYDNSGRLHTESQVDEEDRYHGIYREWCEGEWVSFVTSYFHGKEDGIAIQLDREGRAYGGYFMRRGTGRDLWCGRRGEQVTEEWEMRDGVSHGVERWWNGDQQSVHIERRYAQGRLHGVYREWDSDGALASGFPEFFVDGEQVQRAEYARRSEELEDLEPYRAEDDSRERELRWAPRPIPPGARSSSGEDQGAEEE